MAIRPLDIPTAAGTPYGKGDVRHFGEGDAQSAVGLSNPTRHLAERDNLLRDKLNEVIGALNNQEQFVPLPIVRTIVPADSEIVVLNQRIPVGFEARVLNASVAATPTSTEIELNIYYNSVFGGTTGTNIVSTSLEFDAGTSFYQGGEMIVTLKNKGDVSLDVVASVLLTVRPLGAEGSLLEATVVVGPTGATGPTGPAGSAGSVGPAGPAGPAGMVWLGEWSNVTAYAPYSVVSVTASGTTSSFIATTATTGDHPQTTPSVWNPVATGSVGATGAAGAAGSSAHGSVFASASVNGTLITGSDVVSDAILGYNTVVPSSSADLVLVEQFIGTTTSTQGCAMLFGTLRANVTGSGTIVLPRAAYGAKVDYTTSYINAVVSVNGTVPYTGSPNELAVCYPSGSDRYTVKVTNAAPVRIAVSLFGAQLVP